MTEDGKIAFGRMAALRDGELILLACECGVRITPAQVRADVEETLARHPRVRVLGVSCPSCGKTVPLPHPPPVMVRCAVCSTSRQVSQPCPTCPPPVTLSAPQTIEAMRHHVQLALGQLAQLSVAGLVAPAARTVIEVRLYEAMKLADAFDARADATVLNLPGLK